jgi:hypothetical protein
MPTPQRLALWVTAVVMNYQFPKYLPLCFTTELAECTEKKILFFYAISMSFILSLRSL